jgi:hypothetical protein
MNWGEPESQKKKNRWGSEERKETSEEQSIAVTFWGGIVLRVA